MFQRIGAAAYKANLDNTIALCHLLNNPQNKFKSIHIAGTNGKGSTSHMIASVLQTAGYKVGLYTSPHLLDFRERIKINGEMIPENEVVDFIQKYKLEFEKIEPSFFELTVAMAFDYFVIQKVDIALIEVGLGGRLDSTNIITPLVSVITNISFDHTALLGNTLEKIAVEKAGIIKKNVPVVIGETQQEIKNIFIDKVTELNSEITFADEVYQVSKVSQIFEKQLYLKCDVIKHGRDFISGLYSELPALYQTKNIITVLSALDELIKQNFKIDQKQIISGIKNVKSLTGLLGRWQVLSDAPLIIADTGHNEAGIKEVLKQLNVTKFEKLHFVLGMVNDKEIKNILKLLPKNAVYYFCKASIPRALDENSLALQATELGLKGDVFKSVKDAVNSAKKVASNNDLIFIGGSTFVVADAMI